ncbi:MAG: hypothetical protein PHX93_03745 [Candidatus Peribacteraceae bacterium]|jgi:hypothetical protein|nr:hypothetical protein [Candidatus Peribacteraceae bacterium]
MSEPAFAAGFSFQAKDQAEAFQFYYHQHWIRLLWPFCRLLFWNILIVATGIVMLTGDMFAEPLTRHTILIILTAFFLLAHFEFLARLYHYLLYVIVVSDKRIHRIKKTLLTMDDHESTDLWVLQDIHKRQHGIVQNLFGYGTLILQAQETEVRIHFTPEINRRYAALAHLRERARAYISRKDEVLSKTTSS